MKHIDQTANETEVRLYDKQSAFVLDTTKNVAFIGGRGSGKSFAGCVKDISYLWTYPDSRAYICAPTYKMLRDNTFDTFINLIPQSWVKDYHKQEFTVTLTNGSLAYFRSLEKPDHARGPNLSFVHVDEGAFVAEASWVILKATTRLPGFPHQRWITSTPRGRNWVYWEFAAKPRPDYVYYQAHSTENKFLPEDYIEFAEGQSEEYIKQEVGGEFVGFEGLVYKTFSRPVHVSAAPPPGNPLRTWAGVDWGYRDPAVIVVVQDYGRYGLYIPELFFAHGQTIDQHCDAAKELYKKYKITRFFADPSRPDSIAFFLNKGLPTEGATNEILLGIQTVTAQVNRLVDGEARFRVHPSCIDLIDEFESYAYPKKRNESKNFGEIPEDKYNHGLDALRYVLVAMHPSGNAVTEFYRRQLGEKPKLVTVGGIEVPLTQESLTILAGAGISAEVR